MSFEPIYNNKSKILILGTYPSPVSRQAGFYYGHPRNRFWNVMAEILSCEIPVSIEEKKKLLLCSHIALWDVLDSCEINGAADSTIQNPVSNDILSVLQLCPIQAIFLNGSTSYRLFKAFIPDISLPSFRMPSTSPANANFNMTKLIDQWSEIKTYLRENI